MTRILLALIAITGVAAGAAALRVWAALGGRLDPDLVMTTPAADAALLAIGGTVALVILVGAFALLAPRWTPVSGSLAPAGRTARLAAVLVVGTLIGLGVASLGIRLADGRDTARPFWLLLAVSVLLTAPTAALVSWLVGDLAWRGTPAPTPESRERPWPFVAMALLAIVAAVPPALDAADPDTNPDRVCDARLECRWMTVEADQLSHADRPTRVLRYGLRPADRERHGTLVMVTGGPGVSGIVAYDQGESTLDPRLTDWLDIVAFDPRGVGDSGYRDCPDASQRYGQVMDGRLTASMIETFVSDCLRDAEVDPSTLADYGSANIAEDIETIRLDLGVDRIALYGESYGTAIAQRYALAHPDRLDALILDGPLDISAPTDRTWAESTASFEATLAATFDACRADTDCADDMPDPDGAWRRTLAALDGRAEVARYADSAGDPTNWPVIRSAVVDSVLNGLYGETGRMLALRAIAAADRGDWVPMARLVHAGLGTLEPSATSSDFAYYATWCADRVVVPPDGGLGAYLRSADDAGLTTPPMADVYLSGAACHAWPIPPGPLPASTLPAGSDFPVVILTAAADPITPAATAYRLADRFRATTDVYMVATSGGPHVTFGRGDACPDDVVAELLTSGSRPRRSITSCPGAVIDPYVGLVRRAVGEDELSFLGRSLAVELLATPEYQDWDGAAPLAFGCRFGGRIEVARRDQADRIDVRGCQVVEGRSLSGTGTYRDDGSVEFEVTFARGSLRYDIDAAGHARWSGTVDGRAITGRG
ncbi:MAG TPA: alpha/beta fold hydrolase [Candidatus Limnocylindrales bacterium]|nr:alpha/beta fold hydrolase [Candidatus Limnocylindrales bacterium]